MLLALAEILVFLTLEMTGCHMSGSEKWLTFHWQSWSVGIHRQQKDLPPVKSGHCTSSIFTSRERLGQEMDKIFFIIIFRQLALTTPTT